MTNFVPYWDQKKLGEITQAEIDAFNMERFRFVEDTRSAAARGDLAFVRSAALQLIEQTLNVATDGTTVVANNTATGTDETIW